MSAALELLSNVLAGLGQTAIVAITFFLWRIDRRLVRLEAFFERGLRIASANKVVALNKSFKASHSMPK